MKKIILFGLFITLNIMAQNLDRVRLHQEMNFITEDSQDDEVNKTKTENEPIAEVTVPSDLENRYFQDSTKTRQAAPKKIREK